MWQILDFPEKPFKLLKCKTPSLSCYVNRTLFEKSASSKLVSVGKFPGALTIGSQLKHKLSSGWSIQVKQTQQQQKKQDQF